MEENKERWYRNPKMFRKDRINNMIEELTREGANYTFYPYEFEDTIFYKNIEEKEKIRYFQQHADASVHKEDEAKIKQITKELSDELQYETVTKEGYGVYEEDYPYESWDKNNNCFTRFIEKYSVQETNKNTFDTEKIVLKDGTEITYQHHQQCYEEVYADFCALEDTGFDEADVDVFKIEYVPGGGVRIDGWFIPCYNYQNGYYSADLRLIVSTPDGVKYYIDAYNCAKTHENHTQHHKHNYSGAYQVK